MVRHPTQKRRGGAAIEFAVLFPFLMYLAVIGTDWARLFYYSITVEGCARAGAIYAADTAGQPESPYTSVQDAALKSAPNLNPTPTVTSSAVTVSGRPGVQVTVSMPFTTMTNFPGVPKSQTITRTVEMRIIPVTPN